MVDWNELYKDFCPNLKALEQYVVLYAHVRMLGDEDIDECEEELPLWKIDKELNLLFW